MNQPALELSEGREDEQQQLSPLTIIRTETALSRFPVHRLAKKGLVQIEIRNQSSALLWEVTYNSKYGQPGPLAYKLDSLIINRRIEEAGRPIPGTIKLGSLAQIAQELGLMRDTNSVKAALLQNAFAAINAKITYRAVDRSERTLEAAFTRYAVVFTGEKLPDGRPADAVYLVLHPIYAEVLNAALTRPLDYDYMKTLPPAAQRFYEIVSYQIYAALHYQNERAKLRYSEYCLLSTATRYLDFDHVKKQMYKVHKPHLESGYLAKVGYEETIDAQGQPDWWMYYVPGPNASREYRAFTGNVRKSGKAFRRDAKEKQGGSASGQPLFLPFPELGQQEEPAQAQPQQRPQQPVRRGVPAAAVPNQTPEPEGETGAADTSETAALVAELIAAELNREVAERFARDNPEECRRQLTYLPYVTEFKTSRGAYLRRAIEQGFAPPAAYTREQQAADAQRKKQAEAQRRKAAEATKRAAEASKAAEVDEDMARLEKDAPEAFSGFRAYCREQERQVQAKYANMPPSVRERMLKGWDTPEKRRELFCIWRQLSEAEQLQCDDEQRTGGSANRSSVAATVPEEEPEAIRSLIASSLEEGEADA